MYISHEPVSIKLVNAQIGSLLKPTVLFPGGREYHGWAVHEDFHFLMETYILFEFVQLICFTFITFKTIKSKVRLYSV